MSNALAWRQLTLDAVIHTPIESDPRTTEKAYLGWPKDTVYADVIKGGQADFDAPHPPLSGEDKALLYAKYNQPGHLTELDIALGKLLGDSKELHQPYVFDIGCGPFTAGLALAAVLGNQRIFHYHGVDLYASMRAIGLRLAAKANEFSGLNSATTYKFYSALKDVPFPSAARNNAKIFITSYLLSSGTLDVHELANDIARIADNYSFGPSFLLYTNGVSEYVQRKFPAFRTTLEQHGFTCLGPELATIDHKNKVRKLSYALFYKAG